MEMKEIRGITHELDEDRSIFVGQEPGNGFVYVRFSNGELETKVKLSFDGAVALRDLLGAISSRGLISQTTWLVVSDIQLQGEETK